MAAIVALSLASFSCAGGAQAQSVEALWAATSVDDRMALRCPPQEAVTGVAKPIRRYPAETVPLWQDFSDAGELVLVEGVWSEGYFDLALGDDIALIYNAVGETSVVGGLGADTVLVCSVADLDATVDLVDRSADSVVDIVIVEADVFRNVPDGMSRVLSLEVDGAMDRIVLRYPAGLEVDMPTEGGTMAQIGLVKFGIGPYDPRSVITLIPEE